jgi:hypothetical protein
VGTDEISNQKRRTKTMNKGISLTALAQEIERQKEAKHDLIASTAAISMTSNGNTLTIDDAGDDGFEEYGINQTAHSQIAARLQIPAKYYDRMRTAAPALLATNVNEWFHRNPERRLVRTLDGRARAFLSDRYQRIDNAEIAEVALPVLASIPDVQIVSSQITEHRMYIQAVSPRLEGEVKKGDAVQAGVIISNSEIGMGSVSVQPVIWRLICLNGMISQDGAFKAYHVGRRIEDSAELWADDTRKADDRAVLLKVRDMVATAVERVSFQKRLDQMRGLTEAKVEGNPVKLVEVLSKRIGANETEQGGILRSLIEGGDLSAWGVLNAVTAQAHTADYDRAVEFEAAGGQLLNLAPSEWSRMLEAA